MLQLDLSQIQELDLCLQSGHQAGSKDSEMPQFVELLTGLRRFTDRSGQSMAKHIKVPHQLERLCFPRDLGSQAQSLSHLVQTAWTSQATRPKLTKIKVR